MNIIIGLMAFLAFLIGILLVIHQYAFIIRGREAADRQPNEQGSERFISILDSDASAYDKADAFVSLMMCSYVLVHTLINHGNKYNDRKQKEFFCASLTPERMKAINSLEENDGQYSF